MEHTRVPMKIAGLLAICMVAVCAVLVLPGQSYAGTITKDGASYHKIAVGKTVSKYDVTGDGVADKIKISVRDHDDEYYYIDRYKVTINGTKVLGWKDTYAYSMSARVYKMGNGKTFLRISQLSDNDYDDADLYRYKGGKLVKVLNFNTTLNKNLNNGTHNKGVVVAVGKNTITVRAQIQSNFCSTVYCRIVYKWKSGKLARVNRIAKVHYSYEAYDGKSYIQMMDGELTLNRSIKGYKNARCAEYKGVLKAGGRYTVTHLYFRAGKLRFRVVSDTGAVSWVKNPLGCNLDAESSTWFDEKHRAG